MNLNIGGRPISKVLLAFLGSLVTIVVTAILAVGPDVINWSGGEWLLFLVGTIAPPTIAFMKSLVPKDVIQIIESIPPAQLEQYLKAAGALDKIGAFKQEVMSTATPVSPLRKHDSPY